GGPVNAPARRPGPARCAAAWSAHQGKEDRVDDLFATRVAQRIGGAVGIAVLAVILQHSTGDAHTPSALADGFGTAFWWSVAWRADLHPKIQVVRELAREYGAHLLAAGSMFAELAATTGPEYWAADGVHPTPAGHAALASAWLRLVA
ncbi:hypothetical protein ACWGPL_37595, partial [Streptomyces platensis]